MARAAAESQRRRRDRWLRLAHFPIVRGSAIDGHGWSTGDARNPSEIIELKMVARDGIEPSTRGYSVARRAEFGTSKPKTGNGFSTGRPNRPRRPRPYRTPGVGADRAAE